MLYSLIIFFFSFISGIITLFFSFGLNIILIPILSIFIPIQLAIAYSGIVYLFFNIVRLILIRKYICFRVVIKFIPISILGVILGGILLNYILLIFTYKELKIFMSIILLILVFIEYFNILTKLNISRNIFTYIGGFISGFAGGLVGFQGPFRAAALLNLKLDSQTFFSTSAMIGLMIDGSRLLVYFFTFLNISEILNPSLLVMIIGSILSFIIFFPFTKKIKMEKLKPYILILIIILVIVMLFS